MQYILFYQAVVSIVCLCILYTKTTHKHFVLLAMVVVFFFNGLVFGWIDIVSMQINNDIRRVELIRQSKILKQELRPPGGQESGYGMVHAYYLLESPGKFDKDVHLTAIRVNEDQVVNFGLVFGVAGVLFCLFFVGTVHLKNKQSSNLE